MTVKIGYEQGFKEGAASRDVAFAELEQDYSAKCNELEIVHAEIEALRADAGRWCFIRKHWKNIRFTFQMEPNVIKGFTLTVSTKVNNSNAVYIEREIDAAIAAKETP